MDNFLIYKYNQMAQVTENNQMAQATEQLDYKQKDLVYPSYRMTRVLPLSGSTTQTVTTGGGQETIFEIPVNAVNFARSYLNFQFQIPAAPNPGYNCTFMDCFPHFRQIQLYTRSGIYLMDLNEAANYTKVVLNAETKLDDFLNNGIMRGLVGAAGAAAVRPGALGSGAHFQRNNSTNITEPASRLTLGAFAGAGASDLSYTEPMYVSRSDVEAGAGQSVINYNVCLPLNLYKNTILETDKDIYFGEIMILRVVWSPSVKIAYTNTNAANLDTGAAALVVSVAVSALSLYLAVEKNTEIVNLLRSKIAGGGFPLLIPYVYTYKNSLLGTSQNVSLRFNRGHGRKLIKIYHAIFNGTEQSNTAYDHNNINGAKCASYYTMLNNERIQEFNVEPTNLDDWNLMKKCLKGSVLQTSNMYQYNWFHLDKFDGLCQKVEGELSNIDTGLDLSIEQKWDIYCTTTNAAYNHYDFAVTQKMLTITSAGITVI